jgi:hypothetical protein
MQAGLLTDQGRHAKHAALFLVSKVSSFTLLFSLYLAIAAKRGRFFGLSAAQCGHFCGEIIFFFLNAIAQLEHRKASDFCADASSLCRFSNESRDGLIWVHDEWLL